MEYFLAFMKFEGCKTFMRRKIATLTQKFKFKRSPIPPVRFVL